MKQFLPAMVIDDDPQVRHFVADTLRMDEWDVTEAESAEAAFRLSKEKPWAIVFCDVRLGDADGYDVLRRFLIEYPKTRMVLMTGYESAAGALDATAIGAYDYLVKPFTVTSILNLTTAVREQYQIKSQTNAAELTASDSYISDIKLIGRSPAFVESMKMVGRVSPTNLPVLITGESGTGKEMVARAIHQRSNRSSGEFVAVNCGAIPVELIESEFFGHTRGSFTGADRERLGLWEEASGGTIFLDEITETAPQFQVKILRALQQNEIRRVGSNRIIKTDVRVIAATNRNIEQEVSEGRFRQDLMYRLNAVTISLPPLRERSEDIPILAEYFAKRIRLQQAPVKFSASAMEILKNAHWQGNIRELENTILHAISLCDQIVYPEHLPTRLQASAQKFPPASSKNCENTPDFFLQPEENNWLSLEEVAAKYVLKVLAHTKGNKQAAARILNIDRKTLTRIINRFDQ